MSGQRCFWCGGPDMNGPLSDENERLRLEALEDEGKITKLEARVAELTEAGSYLAAEAESDWNSGRISVDLWGAVCSWRQTLAGKQPQEGE